MTPKERVMNRLEGKPVDKIPNFNIVMLFAAKHAGVQYGDFCFDYRKLVEAQYKTAVDFGIDILSTMSDPYRETHDYGVPIKRVEDDLPVCEGILIGDIDEMDKVKLWDPMTSTRMLDRILAVELFKKNYGDEYPILGWVEGPMAEFTDLATISEGMYMMFDEPDKVKEVMAVITQQAIRCALAQLEAGADFIGIGDAAASLISNEQYREFVMPLEAKIVEAVHKAGGKTKLHICGNINHILESMIETGSDVIDIDYMVDFETAIQLAGGKCSISGNLDPVEVILQSSVKSIREKTRFCMEKGGARSMFSGGCEVPKMTPPENLKAMDNELRS